MANSDSKTPPADRPIALLLALAVSITLNVVTLVAFPAILLFSHLGHYYHHHGMAGGPPEFGSGPREEHHGGMMGHPFGWDGPMMGTPPAPEVMVQRKLDLLSERLTLTDAEKTLIKPILLQQATDVEKLHDQAKATVKQSLNQSDAKIRAALTPDQQKQFDAMQAERDARFQEHP